MTELSNRVRLSDVLSRIKHQVSIREEQTYTRLKIKMNGKGIEIRDKVNGFQIGTKHQFIAKAGQLVLSKIDARNGAFGILPASCDNAIITGNFWAFDVDVDRLVPKYFDYVTKTPLFLDFCIRASEGTTNRRYLQEDLFLDQPIILPPVAEQRRIVGLIGEVVERIYEAENLRRTASTQTEAMIVSTHLSLSVARPEPLSNYLALDEEAVSIELGKPYPQVGVRGFGAGLFRKQAVIGGDTSYRAFNRLYPGAFVLSQVKGWEGAVAVVPDDLVGWFVSPEYRTFRCREDRCLPAYLSTIVSTEFFWGLLKDATRGVGARRERTRPEQFLKLEFSMPSIADQLRAIEVFGHIHSAQLSQTETAIELDAMLPAILDKAFKGEL